ncbi:conserved hypothetical protein [Culex quinquefasciatus]|uniref:Uncharacterized protein n=1 Tax=Culex quinquefasciatus TaxID=7176 RepID=B0XE71_CULQU|nr:conserved hypothetical protein [Culex quinquefasciatus]|eukprot:XP_001867943.1 conserved hypothetical protein [Culex quinquefasciatus]
MSEIRDWLATTIKQNFNFEGILATQLWSHTSHMAQTLDQQHGHNRRPTTIGSTLARTNIYLNNELACCTRYLDDAQTEDAVQQILRAQRHQLARVTSNEGLDPANGRCDTVNKNLFNANAKTTICCSTIKAAVRLSLTRSNFDRM